MTDNGQNLKGFFKKTELGKYHISMEMDEDYNKLKMESLKKSNPN